MSSIVIEDTASELSMITLLCCIDTGILPEL